MADLGVQFTDEEEKKLERKIREVYAQAEQEINEKITDFYNRYNKKLHIKYAELQAGKITQEQYNSWVAGQMFQGERWRAKKEQIARTLADANKIALDMVNKSKMDVFTFNSNYQAYTLEHGAGVNFGFDLYDETTVANLMKNNPTLLPMKKLDLSKDIPWNMQNINREITQGIVQGESLQQIASRMSRATGSTNEKAMMRTARTAMTGAQNAGRNIRIEEASRKGIKCVKEWIATFDGRTRDSHRAIDGEKVKAGQEVKFSNGCRYPGDPQGPPREVYNCRCTMAGDLEDYPEEYERYDNINGRPVKEMTYTAWERAKNGPKFNQVGIGGCKTVQEVNNLLNTPGLFKTVADLTGCDLDSAKSIAAAYEQVFSKFPQLKGKFDAPDAQPYNMNRNTYAWCYSKSTGKVQVNPEMFNNWREVVKSYNDDVLKGFHPFGTTAESIVTHEIGHSIDGLLAREGILGGVTSSGEYRFASSSLKNTIMKRAAKKDPELAELMEIDHWLKDDSAVVNYVSKYATKNNKEWFAECFAEYITSANPRVVATEFGKELERLVSKL